MSEYLDLPLGEFFDLVASGNPAPGGGSVAAVAVNAQPGTTSPHAMFFDLGLSSDMFGPFIPAGNVAMSNLRACP